eukprot:6213681-Pleurochrysis_carterae.AAC.5
MHTRKIQTSARRRADQHYSSAETVNSMAWKGRSKCGEQGRGGGDAVRLSASRPVAAETAATATNMEFVRDIL